MHVLIILAHPDKNSFNHAIAYKCRERLVKNGHTPILHDLYEENFNPILTSNEIPKHSKTDDVISQHCHEILNTGGIIIIHPNWWGQPPAILTGWIDRVLRPGVAYEFKEGDAGEGVPVGLLKATCGIVFNTSNTSEERENKIFFDPLETIWKNCIFYLCGVRNVYRKMFRIMITSTPTQRNNWLKEVEQVIDKYFPA
jgi:NAD(P)H dehydrogenase (quinone)